PVAEAGGAEAGGAWAAAAPETAETSSTARIIYGTSVISALLCPRCGLHSRHPCLNRPIHAASPPCSACSHRRLAVDAARRHRGARYSRQARRRRVLASRRDVV